MKRIKYIYISILCVIIISCVQSNGQNHNERVHAEYATLSKHIGKTIKSITYYNNGTPYHMVILFTDNTTLDIVANKYVLDIQE